MKVLRLILVVYASFCLFGAVGIFLSQKSVLMFSIGIYLLVNSVVIFAGTLFEKRYKSKGLSTTDLKPTGKRFIDNKRGKVVEVYLNPKTGEQSYVDI